MQERLTPGSFRTFHDVRYRFGSYAAAMEREASATTRLTFASPSSAQSLAIRCRDVAMRCLKATARCYVESAVYGPYWIDPSPLTILDERADALRDNRQLTEEES